MPPIHVAIIRYNNDVDSISHKFDAADFDIVLLLRHNGVQLPSSVGDERCDNKVTALHLTRSVLGTRLKGIRRCVHVPRSTLYVVSLPNSKDIRSLVEQYSMRGTLLMNMGKLANIQEIFNTPIDAQTAYLLEQLKQWLRAGIDRRGERFVCDMFMRCPAVERLSCCVHNPGDLSELRNCERYMTDSPSTSDKLNMPVATNKRRHSLDPSQLDTEVKSANNARAGLIQLDKCDKLVMNPLYKSDMEYGSSVKFFLRDATRGYADDGSIISSDTSLGQVSSAGYSTSTSTNSGLNDGVNEWSTNYPLHARAYKGDVQVLQQLLQQGYNSNQADRYSWTPLHYAVWYSHLDCVGALLSFGDECDVNARTRNGSTPLHFAAKIGAVHVVELLMSHARIELNATDNDGKTPLQICEADARQCAQECAAILRAAAKRDYTQKIQIEFIDGSNCMISLLSGDDTTAHQLHKQVCDMLMLSHEERRLFKIWICSENLELQLKDEHKPITQMSRWARNVQKYAEVKDGANEQPRLYFRRDTRTTMEDEKSIKLSDNAHNLLYHEARQNFLNGFYPCKDNDLVIMCALLLQIVHGQHQSDVNDRRILSQTHTRAKIIPAHKLHGHARSLEKLISAIITEHRKLRTTGTRSLIGLQSNFLSFCRTLLVYGATFFRADMYVLRPTSEAVEVLAGVNDIGLHLLNARNKQLMKSYLISDNSFTYQHEIDKPFIEVKARDRQFRLNTPKAPHIANLLKQARLRHNA